MKSFVRRCLRRAKEIDIAKASVIIAYYLMLSLFPMLLSAGAILPYFHIQPASLSPYLENIVPLPILAALQPAIDGLLTTQNDGLLSLGVIGMVWSASKGISYVRAGINNAYCLKTTHQFLTTRILSVGVLIVIIALLAVLMLAFGFGTSLLNFITSAIGWTAPIVQYFGALRWPVTFVALYVMLLFIYKLTPDIKTRLRDVWMGAFAVTISLMALGELFALYLTLFTKSLTAYGIISAVFMLMIWLRLLGYLLLLGAVMNATLFERKGIPPQKKRSVLDHAVMKVKGKLFR